MEMFTKKSNECVQIKKISTVPIDDLDGCTTQDACDFEQHFVDDSSRSDDKPDKKDAKSKLRLNIGSYLKDLEPPSIMSPISELAVNIAKTKLFPANGNDVTGKYNKFQVS